MFFGAFCRKIMIIYLKIKNKCLCWGGWVEILGVAMLHGGVVPEPVVGCGEYGSLLSQLLEDYSQKDPAIAQS